MQSCGIWIIWTTCCFTQLLLRMNVFMALSLSISSSHIVDCNYETRNNNCTANWEQTSSIWIVNCLLQLEGSILSCFLRLLNCVAPTYAFIWLQLHKQLGNNAAWYLPPQICSCRLFLECFWLWCSASTTKRVGILLFHQRNVPQKGKSMCGMLYQGMQLAW